MNTFRTIGLMSGTSLDGIDAVYNEIQLDSGRYAIQKTFHHTLPYSPSFRKMLLEVLQSHDLKACEELNTEFSNHCVDLVLACLAKNQLDPSETDVIGSHGQTILHQPPSMSDKPFSLQIGNLSLIAQKTGITTVGRFRSRDICVEGEGAPLAPYGHRILFSKLAPCLAVHNLGGISNITILENSKVCSSFDTGPANMWIDFVVQQLSNHQQQYDAQGSLARTGTPDQAMIDRLLAHEYFEGKPPKSTGWRMFGSNYLQQFLSELQKLSLSDALSTVTHATARSIQKAYQDFIFDKYHPQKIVFCGGGSQNQFLIELLREQLSPIPVHLSSEFNVNPQHVECISFGLLALDTIRGRFNNEPAATGAKERVVCGEIAWGNRQVHLERLKQILLN